jgi:phosphoribosylglycinamide formyltransferase-1
VKRIAVLASGAGSNAKKIIEHFSKSNKARVVLLACNKPNAGVLDIARAQKIETYILNKPNFIDSDVFLNELHRNKIDFVVLAGFLWHVPKHLVSAFPNKIVNIHPALLPKYGGKGMYGHHVHEAVFANKDTHTGITIHWVNEHYDEGTIIFQSSVTLAPNETQESIEQKVRALELTHYASVIDSLL